MVDSLWYTEEISMVKYDMDLSILVMNLWKLLYIPVGKKIYGDDFEKNQDGSLSSVVIASSLCLLIISSIIGLIFVLWNLG